MCIVKWYMQGLNVTCPLCKRSFKTISSFDYTLKCPSLQDSDSDEEEEEEYEEEEDEYEDEELSPEVMVEYDERDYMPEGVINRGVPTFVSIPANLDMGPLYQRLQLEESVVKDIEDKREELVK